MSTDKIGQARRFKRHYDKHKNELYAKNREWLAAHPEFRLFHSAKSRAKKRGILFTISVNDIIMVDVCPLLGIPLVMGRGKIEDGSASLDRVDVSKGYEPGNIRVISYKANRYKSDMSTDIIKRLYEYVFNGEAGV